MVCLSLEELVMLAGQQVSIMLLLLLQALLYCLLLPGLQLFNMPLHAQQLYIRQLQQTAGQ